MESSENLGLGDTGFSHHEDDELGVDLASFLACRMREGGCRGQGCVLPSEYWKVVLYEWYGSAAHEGAVTASFLIGQCSINHVLMVPELHGTNLPSLLRRLSPYV